MGTVIRMKRGGRTHAPYYRVVVMDSRTRARGREIEQIGFYHPCARPVPLSEIDAAKAVSWLQKGARITDTVRDLFAKKGIMAVFSGNAALETIIPALEPATAAVEPVETAPEPAADAPAATTAETEAAPDGVMAE